VVVVKRRASAFSGSDLDLVLRARDIDSVVLAGIATSAVVLSTACRAIDMDLGLTVLVDGCLDTDAELHRVITENLFPLWGNALTIDEWLASIAPGGATP
jgi:nicotinamidase-related amidase